jgi:ornithine cyclodeaminase/alanine dehydrogenase-like protein (mu-crystallin family)
MDSPTDPVVSAVALDALWIARRLLRPRVVTAGVVGTNDLTNAYLLLLPRIVFRLTHVALTGPDPDLCFSLWDRHVGPLRQYGVELSLAFSAREAALGADLVLAATSAAAARLRRTWLLPRAVIVVQGPVEPGWEVLSGEHRVVRAGRGPLRPAVGAPALDGGARALDGRAVTIVEAI